MKVASSLLLPLRFGFPLSSFRVIIHVLTPVSCFWHTRMLIHSTSFNVPFKLLFAHTHAETQRKYWCRL